MSQKQKHNIAEGYANLATPIEEVHLDDKNARVGHDIDGIASSLADYGQRKCIIANRLESGRILAGNGTYKAAVKLGWTHVAVLWVEDDRATATGFAIADNRLGDKSAFDENILAELLAELPSATNTGFSDSEMQILLAQVGVGEPEEGIEAEAEPSRAEELQLKWQTELGQLWILPSRSGRGEHRLICGDCTDEDTIIILMDGQKAECMPTDPPYGVLYVGKTKHALTIKNDGSEDLESLLMASFGTADKMALAEGASIYVAHPAGALSLVFMQCFLAMDWRLHQTLVWVKDSMVLGHSDYHYMHEPILFGYKKGNGRFGRGSKGWYGDASQVSVFSIPRPKASREHPTMKPLELYEEFIKNSCAIGGLCYEPFGGSGTTLLAAESTGRICYSSELAPEYVAVILERYEVATGIKPILKETYKRDS